MALKDSKNDREKDKFVETTDGKTAIRIQVNNQALVDTMALSPSVNDREKAKFVETTGGDTAVRVTVENPEDITGILAENVVVTPTGGLTSTDVQAALEELQSEITGGGGAVSSVFGRTGAVTAQSGDYTASQITGFDEASQDAVGSMIADTASINLTYTDATPELKADVIPSGVDHDALLNFVANEHVDHSSVTVTGTGVLGGGGDLTASRTISHNTIGTAGTYGSASQVPVITTDAYGHVSSVANTSIAIGASAVSNTPAGNIAATDVQAAINELDSEKQPIDSDLTAIAGLSSNGLIAKTGSGTAAARTITAGSNITVSNGDGVSGNPSVSFTALTASRAMVTDGSGQPTVAATTATEVGYLNGVTSAVQTQLDAKQGLDSTLTSLAAYNTNGILTQTSADTFTGRTITAGPNITVSNGNGVSGNPTVSFTPLTASKALVTDGSGQPVAATTTATEIGYVNGVTSAIQTQLDAKQGLDSTLTSLAAYNTNGILTQTAADTFTGRTITGTASQITVTNGDGVSGNPTISLPNIITASTVGSSNGIPNITYDATGRITGTSTNSVNITSSNVSNFSSAAVAAAEAGCTGFQNGLTNSWYGHFATTVTAGTTSIVPSAQMQVDSVYRGFLPPRMTTSQRNAISSPATGLMVYDTDLNQPYFYDGTAWCPVPHRRAAASGIASAQTNTTMTVGSMQFRYSSNATGGNLDIRSSTSSSRSTWVCGQRHTSFITPVVGTNINALIYPNAVSGAWVNINVGGMDGSSCARLSVMDLSDPYQIWKVELRNIVDVVIHLNVEVA